MSVCLPACLPRRIHGVICVTKNSCDGFYAFRSQQDLSLRIHTPMTMSLFVRLLVCSFPYPSVSSFVLVSQFVNVT